MVPLLDLWLPILLSAVFVFLLSSVFHMMLPMHKKDYKRLKDEDAILDKLRPFDIAPGQYMFPSCESFKEMGNEEMKAKMKQGPVGVLTMMPKGDFNMGSSMIAWFLYALVISIFAAYLTRLAVDPGEDYLKVMRVAGAAGVLGFGFWHVPVSIWKAVDWSVTWRFVFDGVIYGLIVGGTFGWLWPAAAAA